MATTYNILAGYPYQLQALVRCVDYTNGYSDRLLKADDIATAEIHYYGYDKATGAKTHLPQLTTEVNASQILGDYEAINTIVKGISNVAGEAFNCNFLYTDNKDLPVSSYYVKIEWTSVNPGTIIPYDTEWYIDILNVDTTPIVVNYVGYLNVYADLFLSDPNLLINATQDGVETNRRVISSDITAVSLTIWKQGFAITGFDGIDVTNDFVITDPITQVVALPNGASQRRTYNAKYILSRRRDTTTTPPTIYDPFAQGNGIYELEFTFTPANAQTYIDPFIVLLDIRR